MNKNHFLDAIAPAFFAVPREPEWDKKALTTLYLWSSCNHWDKKMARFTRTSMMCDATFPILRFGWILKSDHELSPKRAVKIGRQLRSARADLTKNLKDAFYRLPGSPPAIEPDSSLLRVRTMPAVTIDFPPLEFKWNDHHMEFRACFTVCPGSRKAKIWTRYNFKSAQNDKGIVAAFYDWGASSSSLVHDVCLAFYNDQISAANSPSKMTMIYPITIKMVSAANSMIKEELDKEFTRPLEASSPNTAYNLLIKALESDCGLRVRNKELGRRTRLVGFRFPRKRRTEFAGESDRSRPLLAPSSDDFQALCIVDYDRDSLDVTGVAHEEAPPDNYRRSAPYVVSGEISFEVGNAY